MRARWERYFSNHGLVGETGSLSEWGHLLRVVYWEAQSFCVQSGHREKLLRLEQVWYLEPATTPAVLPLDRVALWVLPALLKLASWVAVSARTIARVAWQSPVVCPRR